LNQIGFDGKCINKNNSLRMVSSIHNSRNAKEEDFERMQQEECEKIKLSSSGHLNEEDRRLKYGFFFP
jgi:hypothetical protein